MSDYNRKHKRVEIKVFRGASPEAKPIYTCGDIFITVRFNKIVEVGENVKILVYV